MKEYNDNEISKLTLDYIKDIENYLVKKYGDITQWELSLSMLAQNIELMLMARAELAENGISVLDRNGTIKPNPFIKVLLENQVQVVKLLTQFGLTAYSLTKLHIAETEDPNANNDLNVLFR